MATPTTLEGLDIAVTSLVKDLERQQAPKKAALVHYAYPTGSSPDRRAEFIATISSKLRPGDSYTTDSEGVTVLYSGMRDQFGIPTVVGKAHHALIGRGLPSKASIFPIVKGTVTNGSSVQQIREVAAPNKGFAILSGMETNSVYGVTLEKQVELAHRLPELVDKVRPVYQLKRRKDGTFTGYETLSRLSMDGSNIPPPIFISIARGLGLLQEMTYAVAAQAFVDTQCLLNDDDRKLEVAINIDPRLLQDESLTERLGYLINNAELNPDQVGLELTETPVVFSNGELEERMRALKNLGIASIALDDALTGGSDWQRLLLPFDVVKLDRQYLVEMEDNTPTSAFVEGIASLAKSLGRRLVAEGSNEDQEEQVYGLGADTIQAFYIHRPEPFDDLRKTLRDSGAYPVVKPN